MSSLFSWNKINLVKIIKLIKSNFEIIHARYIGKYALAQLGLLVASPFLSRIYNPSDTTFIKNFVSQFTHDHEASSVFCMNSFSAGYINTTSAIDDIQFKFSSGQIQGGVIQAFGVSG